MPGSHGAVAAVSCEVRQKDRSQNVLRPIAVLRSVAPTRVGDPRDVGIAPHGHFVPSQVSEASSISVGSW